MFLRWKAWAGLAEPARQTAGRKATSCNRRDSPGSCWRTYWIKSSLVSFGTREQNEHFTPAPTGNNCRSGQRKGPRAMGTMNADWLTNWNRSRWTLAKSSYGAVNMKVTNTSKISLGEMMVHHLVPGNKTVNGVRSSWLVITQKFTFSASERCCETLGKLNAGRRWIRLRMKQSVL